jgi:hypothetical protein
MVKTKKMAMGGMGGAAKAVSQAVKAAPKPGPAPQMPSRGMPPPQSMPPRGMPPRGDTGTNIQKIDYAAQNAAGPGRLGNYGPPPNLPAQMPIQTQSNMSAAPPGKVPQGMPPTVSGNQAKSMGLGMKKGGMTASKRADGCAVKGKTKGRFV